MESTTTQRLETPTHCIADFSLVPIGTQNTSYAQEIADIQRLLQRCDLKHQMTCTGTAVEGPWDQVLQVIGHAHLLVHKRGVARIQTDLRVTTRTDKDQPMENEILSVERILTA
ncbi:thiamine-binding protein [Aspergillus melleus]|uniref:thiamine-binding protein n=1 Tax=Aspergillus melleus TaxID=138277 RepID=UPI001E8CAE8E|nr:uncharacterized protein LDX57_005305 [Aspergillus melleus]KAH8427592.1 hypothetical protein LDX57_005305 [Aspergillus melleus]